MRGGEGSWGTSRFGGVRRVVVGGGVGRLSEKHS